MAKGYKLIFKNDKVAEDIIEEENKGLDAKVRRVKGRIREKEAVEKIEE